MGLAAIGVARIVRLADGVAHRRIIRVGTQKIHLLL